VLSRNCLRESDELMRGLINMLNIFTICKLCVKNNEKRTENANKIT
jgi:hypothetical protein